VVPAREQARRKLYDDVGDLLIAHELTLSEVNFAVALAHLSGDPRVTPRVEALLREGAPLSDAAFAALHDELDHAIRPEMLADVAERLTAKLEECLRIVSRSGESAKDFGAAVTHEVAGFERDPLGAFTRLLSLTRSVVDNARAMEEQLGSTRAETERLRGNLQRAQRAADRDHLTGLPNRRCFDSSLAAIDPAAPGGAVALLDIDDFKQINDRHGHEAGDRVLRFFARLLKSELGDEVVVARHGGEEFAVLFPQGDLPLARARLDAARETLVARSLVNQATGVAFGQISFSAGIARLDGDGRKALRAADKALYQAKRDGKNRVVTPA
jgi:diguanylate cyclase